MSYRRQLTLRGIVDVGNFNSVKEVQIAIAFLTLFILFSPLCLAAPLEDIMKRGKLIIGVKDNLPPLGFTDTEGNLQGFEIDIAKRLTEELFGNAEAVILKPVTNLERLEVVINGTVDLTIARVTATSSRFRVIDCSAYYYLDGTGMITKNPTIQDLYPLKSAKIAILDHSSTIAVIRSELPQARLIGVKSYQEALQLLENGQVDAFAADNSILAGWVQEYPQYRQLPVSLSGEALCVVMPKGLQYDSLRNRVNEAIARWRASGWLRERATYWGLP